jgi:hypothetical protein
MRWRLDVMIDPGTRDTWVFRRDRRIEMPRSGMIFADGDIPYLKPEGVLLYKAKSSRAKDEMDFAACAARLDGGARQWLKDSLSLAHPDHPWIERLERCRMERRED